MGFKKGDIVQHTSGWPDIYFYVTAVTKEISEAGVFGGYLISLCAINGNTSLNGVWISRDFMLVDISDFCEVEKVIYRIPT